MALGGNIEPVNPFVLDLVCERCNWKAGRHIDGPFARSWLVAHDRARVARLAPDGVVPLVPFGRQPEIDYGGLICDLWIGPARDVIYHFHQPYPGDSDAFAGPPTHVPRKDLDPGFVILFVQATNPAWHPIVERAVVAQFEDSPIFVGNAGPGSKMRVRSTKSTEQASCTPKGNCWPR